MPIVVVNIVLILVVFLRLRSCLCAPVKATATKTTTSENTDNHRHDGGRRLVVHDTRPRTTVSISSSVLAGNEGNTHSTAHEANVTSQQQKTTTTLCGDSYRSD